MKWGNLIGRRTTGLLAASLSIAPLHASPESKLVFWGGIAEQQAGEANGPVRGKDFPYLVNLRIREEGQSFTRIGSGGLISDSWIITAKHVAKVYVGNPETRSVSVKFPDGTKRQVVEGFAHPDRDVAILKLDRPVEHIEIPSLPEGDLSADGITLTITGANSTFIAYDVIGFADGDRFYSPDILRGGDSGSPLIVRDADGTEFIAGTLIGPYRLRNDGANQFVRNMSYAQFAQTGGLRDWINEHMAPETVSSQKLEPGDSRSTHGNSILGTPEYRLNRAVYLFQKGQIGDAEILARVLLPDLEGRMREPVVRGLLNQCRKVARSGDTSKAREKAD